MTAINECHPVTAVLVVLRRNRRRKKEKMNYSALNEMNRDRKFLTVTFCA